MILLGSSLLNAPVVGLQTNSELGRTKEAIINPATLVIIAYTVNGPLIPHHETLIRLADVRELGSVGLIVDSADEFVQPDDVVSLQKIYQLHFHLMGIAVLDEHRRKLGKIIDYTVETGGFVVQQLTVRRPFLHSLNDTELIIHRSQIIEINDTSIVVHSQAKAPEPELHEVVGSYINPFRKRPTSEPETITTKQQ